LSENELDRSQFIEMKDLLKDILKELKERNKCHCCHTVEHHYHETINPYQPTLYHPQLSPLITYGDNSTSGKPQSQL
jgi:hypothetical protein